MTRHKKTRKQKITADFHHQVYILKNKDIFVKNPITATIIDQNSYFNAHILKDILKTGILTFSIIALQLILFFLLKTHTISLPNVTY